MPSVSNAALRFLSFAVVGALAGCATIVSPGPYVVPVNSDPPGAVVEYRGAQVGVTPCQVSMHGNSEITLSLQGHHPRIVDVGSGFNGWIVGNLLFGGFIGVIVDCATDNHVKVNTDPVLVSLSPATGAPLAPWVRQEVDPEWHALILRAITEATADGRLDAWEVADLRQVLEPRPASFY